MALSNSFGFGGTNASILFKRAASIRAVTQPAQSDELFFVGRNPA